MSGSLTVESRKNQWEERTLGEVCVVARGQTITKKGAVLSGNIPVIAGGLGPAYFHNQSNIIFFYFITTQTTFFNWYCI